MCWKGCLEVIYSPTTSLPELGQFRSGCPGSSPAMFWIFFKMETPHHLWATHSSCVSVFDRCSWGTPIRTLHRRWSFVCLQQTKFYFVVKHLHSARDKCQFHKSEAQSFRLCHTYHAYSFKPRQEQHCLNKSNRKYMFTQHLHTAISLAPVHESKPCWYIRDYS